MLVFEERGKPENPLGEGVSDLTRHLSHNPHLDTLNLVDVKMTKKQVNILSEAVPQTKISHLLSTYHVSFVIFVTIRFNILQEQGWRSGESARLPPMCPGFDSRTRRHMWAEFVGSLLCSERFFSGNNDKLSHDKLGAWYRDMAMTAAGLAVKLISLSTNTSSLFVKLISETKLSANTGSV